MTSCSRFQKRKYLAKGAATCSSQHSRRIPPSLLKNVEINGVKIQGPLQIRQYKQQKQGEIAPLLQHLEGNNIGDLPFLHWESFSSSSLKIHHLEFIWKKSTFWVIPLSYQRRRLFNHGKIPFIRPIRIGKFAI